MNKKLRMLRKLKADQQRRAQQAARRAEEILSASSFQTVSRRCVLGSPHSSGPTPVSVPGLLDRGDAMFCAVRPLGLSLLLHPVCWMTYLGY
jgi:hypothetical protein